MLDTGIDIQGLKAMENALLDIAKEIGVKKAAGMMTSSLRDGAKEYHSSIASKATQSDVTRFVKTSKGQRVQIRPGFLKSRIKVRSGTSRGKQTRRFGKDVTSLVQVGVFRVPYIVHYEFGTSKHAANPIIRSAFQRKTTQVVQVINRQLGKRIERAQKRIAKKHQKS